MGAFYKTVVLRAVLNAPEIVSSNWNAVFLSLAIFAAIFLLRAAQEESFKRARSWREKLVAMREHWRRNLRDGAIVTTIGWCALFGISFVKEIYSEHVHEVAAASVFKSARDAKQADNEKLQSRLKELESQANKAANSQACKQEADLLRQQLQVSQAQLQLEYTVSLDLVYQDQQLRIYNRGKTNIFLWGTQLEGYPRDIEKEPRVISPSPTTAFGIGEGFYYLNGAALEKLLVEKFGKNGEGSVSLSLFIEDQEHQKHTIKYVLMANIVNGKVQIRTQNLGVIDGW